MSTIRDDAGETTEHELADGTRVTVRPILPSDAEELRRRFSELSAQSRYSRFLAPMSGLSEQTLRYLTDVDGVDHVALVATTPSHDMKEEVGLGVARFIRLKDDPRVAEAAVTVAENARNRGVARILLAAIARAAVERSIETFRGEVLASNAPMRHLLDELGARVHDAGDATLVFDVPLHHAGTFPHEPDNPLRRLLRAIAERISRERSEAEGRAKT